MPIFDNVADPTTRSVAQRLAEKLRARGVEPAYAYMPIVFAAARILLDGLAEDEALLDQLALQATAGQWTLKANGPR